MQAKNFNLHRSLPGSVFKGLDQQDKSDFNFVQQGPGFSRKQFSPKILDLKRKLTDIGS